MILEPHSILLTTRFRVIGEIDVKTTANLPGSSTPEIQADMCGGRSKDLAGIMRRRLS